MSRFDDIASALAAADWPNVPIGNKAIILAAIDALGTASRMRGTLEMQEAAEAFHLSCEACEGNEIPELCEACFPHYDDARIARRTAIAQTAGHRPTDPHSPGSQRGGE